jgi:hypothetical protein
VVVAPFLLLVSCVTVVASAVSNLPAVVTRQQTTEAAAATASPAQVDETPAEDAATEEAADPTPAADGPWTIAIKPVTAARQWSTPKAAGNRQGR